jgi:phosphatidylserine decarboxylase
LAARVLITAALVAGILGASWLLWRHYWFFRNPSRIAPEAPVYVKRVAPGADVVVIKQGVSATVKDLMREDFDQPKLVIGIFMSPFDVHYNRAPLDATIGFVKRHAALGRNVHMGPMHWRSVLGVEPRYEGSMHIVQNERAVTQFIAAYRGAPLSLYVVQIGALTVNGIDSYFTPGQFVSRGATFGMIRIGSQVDLIVPWRAGFDVKVQSGDFVKAGETILVD